MLGAHFTTYILWGHISWVIFCLWKAHGNILLYLWPKDFWSKILEANLGKGLLYSCVCFNALSCFEAFGIMMNRTTLGPDLTIKLDPDHSCMAMWFNLVGSPNLLENLRNSPRHCLSTKDKGAHIHLETPPLHPGTPKSRTLLQAQSTQMLEPNCPRKPQQVSFTLEVQSRWNCTRWDKFSINNRTEKRGDKGKVADLRNTSPSDNQAAKSPEKQPHSNVNP